MVSPLTPLAVDRDVPPAAGVAAAALAVSSLTPLSPRCVARSCAKLSGPPLGLCRAACSLLTPSSAAAAACLASYASWVGVRGSGSGSGLGSGLELGLGQGLGLVLGLGSGPGLGLRLESGLLVGVGLG